MNELKSHLFDNYLIKLLGLQIWNSIRMVDITSVGVVAFFLVALGLSFSLDIYFME